MSKPETTTKRVLVCGGRDYADWDKVRCTLDDLHAVYGIGHIFHGRGFRAHNSPIRQPIGGIDPHKSEAPGRGT